MLCWRYGYKIFFPASLHVTKEKLPLLFGLNLQRPPSHEKNFVVHVSDAHFFSFWMAVDGLPSSHVSPTTGG